MAPFIVTGIVVGSIIALGAIGLTLIYGILNFAHFAHGDMMTLGAYLAFLVLVPGGRIGPLSFGYGMVLAILVAMALVAALSIVIDRLVYRPLRARGSGLVVFAIASLGVAIILRSFVYLGWGPDWYTYVSGVHPALSFPLGIKIKPDQIFIGSLALVLVGGVYLLLYRTKMGKAMRAMADNVELARVAGIDTERVIVWTWAIGGSLAAAAGVLLGIQAKLEPEMGFTLLLPLFAATILGGIGSPQGAFLGAMIVGISQEMFVYVTLQLPTDAISPNYKYAMAFMILFVILLVRPRGLFGVKA